MTSRLEGLPMGLLEAFAYGLPCFVTKGTNMKAEVEDYDAGWTCTGTETDIKDSLLRIIGERNLLTQKGKNAMALSQQYQWDKIAMQFHNVIQAL